MPKHNAHGIEIANPHARRWTLPRLMTANMSAPRKGRATLTGIIAARNIVKTTSRIRKILQFAVQGVGCNAPWSASQHLCGQRDFAALDHEAF
jgi:hypothetical protein